LEKELKEHVLMVAMPDPAGIELKRRELESIIQAAMGAYVAGDGARQRIVSSEGLFAQALRAEAMATAFRGLGKDASATEWRGKGESYRLEAEARQKAEQKAAEEDARLNREELEKSSRQAGLRRIEVGAEEAAAEDQPEEKAKRGRA
jgi:alpha-beta hydrolase superfamily lysophospholipase